MGRFHSTGVPGTLGTTPALRLDRRRWLRGLAGAAAVPGVGASPGVGSASGSGAAVAGRDAGRLRSLRPVGVDDSGFGVAARRGFAADLLTLFPNQSGVFPGRQVFLLPAPPWYTGAAPRAVQRTWDVQVPAGLPLYLMAAADPSGSLDPAGVAVSVDGEPVTNLVKYVRLHGRAVFSGYPADYAVLDLVLPPPPGPVRLEVRVRYPGGRDASTVPDPSFLLAGPPESLLVYDVAVRPADALSPLVLRDGARRLWALQGDVRRAVPDAQTFRLLGYEETAAVDVSPAFLEALPEGEALPALREGLPVRAGPGQPAFRLAGGRREWLGGADVYPDGVFGGQGGAVVDAAVLQTVPPVLSDGLLLKGSAPDVFHVDRETLRKVPDWKWVTDRGLDPAGTFYVPDRVVATLPQNSPHWVMPGGAFHDASFYSAALGRPAPYRVYLPAEYRRPEAAGKRYPVVYLLHGRSGRYDEWSGYGAEQVANELWRAGKLGPVILIAPQGGLGYWTNQDGGTAWADYVAVDLVGHVDATYRTVARREARAVGGLSMGGHGALQIGLNYPGVFGVVGAHSPSLPPVDSAPAYFGKGHGFARRDPASLVALVDLPSPPLIWLDTGAGDPWRAGAEALHRALVQKGWAHEWHVFGGEHDGWYWGDHLWEYLPFYSRAFVGAGVMEPPSPVAPG